MNKVFIVNERFYTADGAEIVLKGINVVCKSKEAGYIEYLSDEDFSFLKQLGMNTIRFGIFWDGIEPKPYKYNEDYLNKIETFIKNADKNGFYVFLDMHQDLYSVDFCDGAPSWATITRGKEHIQTELWSEAYLLSPAVQTAFDSFWEDEKCSDGIGVMEHFIDMWEMLAKRFGKYNNVLGYDFLNEPFLGSLANMVMPAIFEKLLLSYAEKTKVFLSEEELMQMWMDPSEKLKLLSLFEDEESYRSLIQNAESVTKEFDRNVLTPFYKKICTRIRKIDKSSLLFLEANYFCNTGIESGLLKITDDEDNEIDGLVYSPHGYDLLVDTEDYNANCEGRLKVIFDSHKNVARRLNMPVLIGEWGCFPNANDVQINQAKFLLNIFENMHAGNTYFDYSTIKNNPITKAFL